MLTEPLIQQLRDLRLNGMAVGLAQQARDTLALSFGERLGLLIQHELTERASARLAQRLRWARLPQAAAVEDLDTRTPRGLDPHQLDLTDREIRLLKWTGTLKRSHGRVTLTSARSAAIFGHCIAVFAFFEFAVILLLEGLATHHGLSALQVVKLSGATAFVLAMLWLVHLGYIKPWIIEQRVMRRADPSQQ